MGMESQAHEEWVDGAANARTAIEVLMVMGWNERSVEETTFVALQACKTTMALVAAIHELTEMVGWVLRQMLGGDPETFREKYSGMEVSVRAMVPEADDMAVEAERCLRRAMRMVVSEACEDHEDVHTHIEGMLHYEDEDKGPTELWGTFRALMTVAARLHNGELIKNKEPV